MLTIIFIIALITLACVFLNKISSKSGVPVLFLFLLLGFAIGWRLEYLDNLPMCKIIEGVCSVGLIFIMFYGGFGTRWASAKPVIVESGLLATIGVFITAGLTGVFCHYVLGWGWLKGLLMGSVISSTDAASVFSILRSRKLGLKNNSAPIIEIESGANDPCAYMMTVLIVSLINATDASSGVHVSVFSSIWLVVSQLVLGAGCGLVIANLSIMLLKNHRFPSKGFDSLFIMAIVLLSYAIPTLIGGNGYLSAYIVGIFLGNSEFVGKKQLIAFFDGITNLMQIMIFFVLGAMVTPSDLPKAIVPALLISAFMMLVARPLACESLLTPFKKYPFRQRAFISFVGLRGAASIVFSLYAVTHIIPAAQGIASGKDLFNVVFCMVVISLLFQGSLLPFVAKILKVTDDKNDVMTTFSDYSSFDDVTFGKMTVTANSQWLGKRMRDLKLPEGIVLALIKRGDESIVPKGDTVYQEGDVIVFSCRSYEDGKDCYMFEHPLSKNSKWAGKRIKDYPYKQKSVVVMIRRGNETIIPNGNTVLENGDILVIHQQK